VVVVPAYILPPAPAFFLRTHSPTPCLRVQCWCFGVPWLSYGLPLVPMISFFLLAPEKSGTLSALSTFFPLPHFPPHLFSSHAGLALMRHIPPRSLFNNSFVILIPFNSTCVAQLQVSLSCFFDLFVEGGRPAFLVQLVQASIFF